MGRLKKDHSGWSTSGKWLKLQSELKKFDEPKYKSKKDTNKWCRGKTGKTHNLVRYKPLVYRWYTDSYSYVRTKCLECGKEMYKRKNESLPLIVEVIIHNTPVVETFVTVNGKLSSRQLDSIRYSDYFDF